MALDRRIVIDIIEVLWLTWAVYWFVNAFGNKRTIERRGQLLRAVLFVGAILGARFISAEGIYNFVIFPVTVWSQVVGIALCMAGLGFAIWARRVLGTNWSGVITLKENHELIRAGPYRFVRHPIYTGLILGVLGSVVATNPRLSGVVFLIFFAIALKVKSLAEEEVMQQHFQEKYVRYKREVKSLVPYVW